MKPALMLATQSDGLPTGGGWIYQIKYDGWRVYWDGARLRTRRGWDLTDLVPHICVGLRGRPPLDSELMHPGGRRLLDTLRKRTPHTGSIYMIAFDAPGPRILDKRLSDLWATVAGCTNIYSAQSTKHRAEALSWLRDNTVEGVVAKRLGSTYTACRSAQWLKILNPNYKKGEQQ